MVLGEAISMGLVGVGRLASRGPLAVSMSAVGTALAILAVLAVMLWFTWGTQRNISRGNAVLRWLQDGLPVLGKRATVKWLGSSAVELGIVEPRPPFSEASLVVVLEPRDVPWFWAWSRGRGRRDFLILRARLARPPAVELEIGDERGWTGDDRIRALDESNWAGADWGRPELRVLHALTSDPGIVREAFDRLAQTGRIWRLSVRREPPHLEVHLVPSVVDGPAHTGSSPMVEAFAELARRVEAG